MWAQRHSVVQVVGAVSGLPTLDVPVPKMVNQLWSFLTALDSFVPEQVIEVPKISRPSRCLRTVLSVPQTAEQLVEVPMIISYSREERISERIVEQTVFPSREERISERIVEQTVFPSRDERSSERTVEQLVDIPVYGRGVDIPVYGRGASSRGGPQDSVPAVPGQSSSAFGGGLQDFLPGQGSTAFSGAEHAHVALRRSRRGGGPVGGPQHSVSGQSSTARGRARHRRFAGRLFILPGPGSCGFIESSAEAEFGRAAFGGFRVPVSWQGHFAVDTSVTFVLCADGSGPASWRPTTSRRWVGGEGAWHPLTPSWVPLLAGLFGVFVLPETYSLGFLWFRIVRFPWSYSGHSRSMGNVLIPSAEFGRWPWVGAGACTLHRKPTIDESAPSACCQRRFCLPTEGNLRS